MIRIKKFPRILVTLFTIGYIFSFFSIFDKSKIKFGIIVFVVSITINIIYFLSDEYRSARALYMTKRLIEKGDSERAADLIMFSTKIYSNEEALAHINASKIENRESYKETADILLKRIEENDTPFLRFVISSFYYVSDNKKKIKDLLIEIPEEKRTIKIVRLLGSVLYELKEYDLAIKTFSEFDPPYLPMNEDEIAVVYGIGICYLAKGDKEKAIEYLARVEAKSPRYGNVVNILNELTSEDSKEK